MVSWSHDPYSSRFADLEAEQAQKDRQARRTRQLEDRVEKLESQLKSVLQILEAHGLDGINERTN